MNIDLTNIFLILLIVISIIIYYLHLNVYDIKFYIHSIVSNTFENFNNNISHIDLPKNVTDISLNSLLDKKNILNNLKDSIKKYCFIGDDMGRYCAEINNSDTCLSNEVFNNRQQCMHPDLRY